MTLQLPNHWGKSNRNLQIRDRFLWTHNDANRIPKNNGFNTRRYNEYLCITRHNFHEPQKFIKYP